MGFGKKDHLVGLDIGSAFVKVAELKLSKKGNSLKKFGIAAVPEGVIRDGRIADMDTLSGIIRDLFKSHKIREKKVAISTGGHSVVIKTIATATATEKQLAENIRTEAEQYIPYDIEDVNIDYQILGESEYSPDQMNVLLVAVNKELVDEYMELTRRSGLIPSIIDVDTFALQNLFERLPGQDHSLVTLLADVGASKTSLNIVKDNNSMMMRDMMTGVTQIVEAVTDNMDIEFDTASAVVRGEMAPPGGSEALSKICSGITSGWCSEICEVVHTFESGTNELQLEQVILSGGGGFIKSLGRQLKAELNVPIFNIDPFEGLTINSKQFGNLEKYKLQAPIALGLAMRRVDDK